MLTADQLKQLAVECSIAGSALEATNTPVEDIETEKDVSVILQSFGSGARAPLNFLGAGSYQFYQPVALGAVSRFDGAYAGLLSPENFKRIKQVVDAKLRHLVSMDHAVSMDKPLHDLLVDVLLKLKNRTSSSKNKSAKVLLPSTLSPALRLALHTSLKYHAIEDMVIGFDVDEGRLSNRQLDTLDTQQILAVVLPFSNFFGVIEDIEQVSRWAKDNEIETLVIADALSLTYLKPPAQLTRDISYLLVDLHTLGFSLTRRGNAPALIARAGELADSDQYNSIISENWLRDLLTINTFFEAQSVEQLQHSFQKAHENLYYLVDQITQIPEVTLRFNSAVVNECVLHFDRIDLERAVQILGGHNIQAGYLLAEDYPELENCLLLHCTDLHNADEIDRFVQKVSTVVKNLSTAGCPVKPKFT